MDWQLVPALLAAGVMALFGIGAALRPGSFELVGVSATTPLGTSELRVIGAMFVAAGLACILTREPAVFATVGAMWLADAGVRLVATVVDRVPLAQAGTVLAVALALGLAIASGAVVA